MVMVDELTICWQTDEPHSDNTITMSEYINDMTLLDITLIDGTYAEGVDCKGQRYGIHASGDGDFCNHKIEFELL